MTRSDDLMARGDASAEEPDAVRTIAYRRSLRASRGRRATARLRRRRGLQGRGSLLVAIAALMLASGGAVAHQSASSSAASSSAATSSKTIVAAQKALGVSADGVVGPRTRAATKRFQRKKGLSADGVLGPRTLKALGVEKITAQATKRRGSSTGDPVLKRIAACESGGDPTAVSADGRYRGKYQFSRQTWREMGGQGDPAQAPEAQQDRMAAKLMRSAGTSPWPNCA